MQLLAPAVQQGAIGGILHEHVFRGVLGVGWRSALEDQLGMDQLRRGVVNLRLGHSRHCINQLVRELSPERCRNLG